MQRKKLPIGIQTLAKIREDDAYYYVDKTDLAVKLIEQGSHYFLSRPRRFGKSLFLDTLKELFEGNAALFTGLYAEKHWNWSVKYPVIRINLAEGVWQSSEIFNIRIREILAENEQRLGAHGTEESIAGRFGGLIRATAEKYGQRVVVLVDEYDKPILDNIDNPDIALIMRDGLRDLYSVIKSRDAEIKFAFLTGVSKFSKVSLFSGLNNLNDITLDPAYGTICGYTDHDLDTVFSP
ncbi:MAG: AAA family ATPase, partial [Trichlorobacter sp.]|nr:AAA family ATPase [Trichlorobacter sp.]